MKMHDNEVDIDAELVKGLVAAQFPRLAHLPVHELRSTGTVNAIYRLGDRLCARLPRVQAWADDLNKEYRWLPVLARRLSLQIPEPVGIGRPTRRYPFSWAVYTWIPGRPYTDGLVDDEHRAAEDLAGFVSELRQVKIVPTAPGGGRRPLRELDADTRAAIVSAGDVIDSAAAIAAWERALSAPAWDGERVWIHGDLLRPNVLVRRGQVAAVIDFGAVGVGDPAMDVVAGWGVFGRAGREAFRRALDVDEGTMARARGYALHQAAMIIPYYGASNPAFVSMAKRTVDEVLSERR
jgi:aminoglycoside phosphotransferase (APT) family kinase protein